MLPKVQEVELGLRGAYFAARRLSVSHTEPSSASFAGAHGRAHVVQLGAELLLLPSSLLLLRATDSVSHRLLIPFSAHGRPQSPSRCTPSRRPALLDPTPVRFSALSASRGEERSGNCGAALTGLRCWNSRCVHGASPSSDSGTPSTLYLGHSYVQKRLIAAYGNVIETRAHRIALGV